MFYYSYIVIISVLLCLFLVLFLYLYYSIKETNLEKNRKIVVIDAFPYFQESLMLSIRLKRMNSSVDYFVIIVSDTTHSGLPLKISFSPFESFIEKYRYKILLYNISFPPKCSKSWCREKYQRVAICSAVKSLNINKKSIVIISDLDEIPTSGAVKYVVKNPPRKFYILSGYMYYYNYRNKIKDSWCGVIVVKASDCNKKIQKYRDKRSKYGKTHSIPVYPALTHCSYCYNKISLIQKKLHSFAHTEYNKPPYTDREYIIYCIKNHISIFDKSNFTFVEYDKNILPLPDDIRFNYLKEEYGLI